MPREMSTITCGSPVFKNGHYNRQRYHESLNNLMSGDVTPGAATSSCLNGEDEKKTMKQRLLPHARAAALLKPDEPELLNIRPPAVSNYLTTDKLARNYLSSALIAAAFTFWLVESEP